MEWNGHDQDATWFVVMMVRSSASQKLETVLLQNLDNP